jgi:hypothetical protein
MPYQMPCFTHFERERGQRRVQVDGVIARLARMLISNRQKVPDFGQSPLLDFTIIHILIFVALSEAFVPH